MRASKLSATAMIAIVLSIVGCGDDSDATSSATTDSEPLSREEYIEAVDAICASSSAAIDTEAEERLGSGTPTIEDLRQVVTEVTVPGLREQYEQIAAIEASPADGEEAERIVEAANEAIDGIAEDPSTILVVVGQPTPFDEVNRLQRSFGFEVCGSPQEPAS